jgi:hypothetical protein
MKKAFAIPNTSFELSWEVLGRKVEPHAGFRRHGFVNVEAEAYEGGDLQISKLPGSPSLLADAEGGVGIL